MFPYTIHLIALKLEDYMLPCMFKKYSGLDCTGCGIQRALAMLLRGEFTEAFIMYPAIYTLILFFLTVAVSFFYKFNYAGKAIAVLAMLNVSIIITHLMFNYLS